MMQHLFFIAGMGICMTTFFTHSETVSSHLNPLEQRTRIGVGIMIFKDGKVLLAKRKGSVCPGEYAFPGGHLEYMESFEDCARREIKEECGIEVTNIRFQYIANTKKYSPKHYINIGLIADWQSGNPEILEPEKSEEWEWYSLDNLPQPMLELCRIAFECYKNDKNGQFYFPDIR